MTIRGTTTDDFCRAVRTLGPSLLTSVTLDWRGWRIEVSEIVLEEELRRRLQQAGLADVEVGR